MERRTPRSMGRSQPGTTLLRLRLIRGLAETTPGRSSHRCLNRRRVPPMPLRSPRKHRRRRRRRTTVWARDLGNRFHRHRFRVPFHKARPCEHRSPQRVAARRPNPGTHPPSAQVCRSRSLLHPLSRTATRRIRPNPRPLGPKARARAST